MQTPAAIQPIRSALRRSNSNSAKSLDHQRERAHSRCVGNRRLLAGCCGSQLCFSQNIGFETHKLQIRREPRPPARASFAAGTGGGSSQCPVALHSPHPGHRGHRRCLHSNGGRGRAHVAQHGPLRAAPAHGPMGRGKRGVCGALRSLGHTYPARVIRRVKRPTAPPTRGATDPPGHRLALR